MFSTQHELRNHKEIAFDNTFQTNSQFCRTIVKGQMEGPYDMAVSANDCLLAAGYMAGGTTQVSQAMA